MLNSSPDDPRFPFYYDKEHRPSTIEEAVNEVRAPLQTTQSDELLNLFGLGYKDPTSFRQTSPYLNR